MSLKTYASHNPAEIDMASTAPWIRMGNRVSIGLGVGILAFSLISISGAVVSTGVVNVETNNKMVQHLDGGIVSKIFVRNGDRVTEGDVVVRLDETVAKATLGITVAKVNDLLVQQARLDAERDRALELVLPQQVRNSASEPALAKIIKVQRTLFEARSVAHRGELEVLTQRVEQSANELAGARKTLTARRREVEISSMELASLQPLYERGFANQQRFLPVQREHARLEGEVGRMASDIARGEAALAEARLRLTQSDKEYTQNVLDELRKVEASLAEATEQRTALEDKMRRVEIRAPRTGHVHALAVHTEGGVIQAGTPIMQIVPEGERLIVDAQIQPQDIDKVRKGQAAYVRFTAFNAKATPRLDGSVMSVSAAQITEQQTNKSYFTAQIALTPEQLAKLPKGHGLIPGMPAEVYIETGDRSIMSYFVKPLLDAMSRTFRES